MRCKNRTLYWFLSFMMIFGETRRGEVILNGDVKCYHPLINWGLFIYLEEVMLLIQTLSTASTHHPSFDGIYFYDIRWVEHITSSLSILLKKTSEYTSWNNTCCFPNDVMTMIVRFYNFFKKDVVSFQVLFFHPFHFVFLYSFFLKKKEENKTKIILIVPFVHTIHAL